MYKITTEKKLSVKRYFIVDECGIFVKVTDGSIISRYDTFARDNSIKVMEWLNNIKGTVSLKPITITSEELNKIFH